MSPKHHWKLFSVLAPILALTAVNADPANSSGEATESAKLASISPSPAGRALFSPRVDYNNKWMPVGRGDPLKKDPTYDYSPPVLDRVQYWADAGAITKTPTTGKQSYSHSYPHHKNKNDILLLGVSSKRPFYSKMDTKKQQQQPIRRNFYPQPLTMLMPPPMQTLNSHSASQDDLTYQSNQHYSQQHSSGWPPSKFHVTADALAQESNSFASVVGLPMNIHEQVNGLSASVNSIAYNKPDSTASGSYSGQYQRKKPWIQALLQKEVTKPHTYVSMETSPNVYESHSMGFSAAHHNDVAQTMWETTTQFSPTITPATMTTDELFSHYRQPEKPMAGPMYLIIQGHSKVKTYGQPDGNGKMHPKIVPVASTVDPVVTHVVSEHENGQKYEVKHLHKKQEEKEPLLGPITRETSMAPMKKNATATPTMSSLLSLLDSSFGDFLLTNEEQLPEESSTDAVDLELNSNEMRKQ